jgi:hypothetical protein
MASGLDQLSPMTPEETNVNALRSLQSAAVRMQQMRSEIQHLSEAVGHLTASLTQQAALAERWKICATDMAKAYRSGAGYRISAALESFDKLSNEPRT